MNNDQLQQLAEEKYPYYDSPLDGPIQWEKQHYEVNKFRAAYISGYTDAMKWVSVETPPEILEGRYSDRVLCITTSGLTRVGFILNGEWMMDSPSESFTSYGYTVTHWMPIPPPSKQ